MPGSLWVLDPDVRYPSHSYLMMVRDKKRMMILRIGYEKGWSALDLPMFVGVLTVIGKRVIGLVMDRNRSLVMDNNKWMTMVEKE